MGDYAKEKKQMGDMAESILVWLSIKSLDATDTSKRLTTRDAISVLETAIEMIRTKADINPLSNIVKEKEVK
jgi:hypothetical protein